MKHLQKYKNFEVISSYWGMCVILFMLLALQLTPVGLVPVFAQSTCVGQYTVQSGDSWAKIAQKHQVGFHELRDANPELWQRRRTVIQPGDCLIIPGQQSTPLELLRNSTYQTWYTESGEVTLEDGRFTTTLVFEDDYNYTAEALIELTEYIAECDIKGGGMTDAAVLL